MPGSQPKSTPQERPTAADHLHDPPSDSDDMEELDKHIRTTPLPVLQLLSVYLIQFGEPVTATVIYPFINQIVTKTGITKGDEGSTGYYAGLIESVFFLSECLIVVQWGYLADRIGRRPVLLCAPLGLALSMLVFGSSESSFWSLMGSRCLQGIFNGNIGVAKSVIAEITDPSNRAAAYGFIPVVWSSGITLGPLLGGVLSNAAERWPNTFGRISYINEHPYFLPCFCAAVLVFLTFVFSFITLKETLPSLVTLKISTTNWPLSEESHLINQPTRKDYGTHSWGSPSFSKMPGLLAEKTGFRSIATRPVLLTMLNQIFLAFMEMAQIALLPIMYSTSIEHGGLGLDPYHIGLILGSYGFGNSIFQAAFFGRIVKRYGQRNLYIFASKNLALCVGMYPVISFFAKRAGGVDYIVAVCIFVQLCLQTAISLGYGCMYLLLIDSVPEGGSITVITGFAQMVASGMRTVGPTVSLSLFAFSVQGHGGILDGNLVYCVLVAIALVGVRCSQLLPVTSCLGVKVVA